MADRDPNLGCTLGCLFGFIKSIDWLDSKKPHNQAYRLSDGVLVLVFTVLGYKVGDLSYLLFDKVIGMITQ